MKLPRWFIGDAVAVDEMGNAILLEGNPHETISAHCGAQIVAGDPCLFCSVVCWGIQRILGRIWPNLRTHCRNAWEAEKRLVSDSTALPGVNQEDPGGE